MDSTVLNNNKNNTVRSNIDTPNAAVYANSDTVGVPTTITSTYATSVDNNHNNSHNNNTTETHRQFLKSNRHNEYIPPSESKICFTRQEIIRWFFNTWLIVMVVIVIIFFISYRYSLQFDRIGNLIQYGYLRGPEGERGPQGKHGKNGLKGKDGVGGAGGDRCASMGVTRSQFLPSHIDPVKWKAKMEAWDRYHEKVMEQDG